MKVIIIGANGMLGKDLAEALCNEYDVIAATRKELDITDHDETNNLIKKVNPDIVINCAAYTNVDAAESEFKEAFKVNALGTRNIAVACNELNIPIVYISSDYVFDGEKNSSYLEYDKTCPINKYGQSKLAGEEAVRQLSPKHYIVRTSWLFGGSSTNFVRTMLKLAQTEQVVRVVDDQFGSPTYTKDLANAIATLIQKPLYGTYHITNSSYCSWYQFAREIFSLSNIDIELVPICSDDLSRPAKRPMFSVLENFVWKLEGYTPLRDYRSALEDYLKSLKLSNDRVGD